MVMERMNEIDYNEVFGEWAAVLPREVMELGLSLRAQARAECDAGHVVYPGDDDLFRALKLTPPSKVRVLVLGQDPYPGDGFACGLAFSVRAESKLPGSLRNIFKEYQSDLGLPAPATGDITAWAQQGVFLLNSFLTVTAGQARSHHKWGWQAFTRAVIDCVHALPVPVVYILWGKDALSCVGDFTSPYPREIIHGPHPSPLSAYRGFFGSRPFSRANAFLVSLGVKPVDWSLP